MYKVGDELVDLWYVKDGSPGYCEVISINDFGMCVRFKHNRMIANRALDDNEMIRKDVFESALYKAMREE